jgi:hypothetical protein
MALSTPSADAQCRWACDSSTLIWAKSTSSDVPLFRVVRDRKVGYIDATGKLVIPYGFDLTFNHDWDFLDGVAPVQIGGKWGYIDSAGSFVIPPLFEWVRPFSEGRALVRLGSGGPPYRIGFIAKDGKFISEMNINGAAGSFSEGFAAVELPGRKWAYIDKAGNIALPQRFAWARHFSQGMARVIEKGGCEVLENICECMDIPADPFEQTKPTEPLSPCRFSFINKMGKTVLTGYQNAQEFREGVAGARRSKLWGFIGPDGSQLIAERFEAVQPFRDGLAAVQIDGKWGFIDHSGEIVIKPQFSITEGFSEGIGLVFQDQQFKFIDKKGTQIFGRTFWVAAPFASGLAHVGLLPRTAGRWAYIDHKGAVVYEYTARQ